jgi:hypothetical protein
MVVVILEIHPSAFIPCKVKMVVETGLMVTDVPVLLPGFQVKDVAPLPARLTDEPAHTVEVDDEMLSTGNV